MILVDSSVWVDYFNGRATRETHYLDTLLGTELVAIGDLILAEVLQGFRSDADFAAAKELMACLTLDDLLGATLALKGAENYRALRKRGVTVRKTAERLFPLFVLSVAFHFYILTGISIPSLNTWD